MKKIILAIFIVFIPAFALPARAVLLNSDYNTYNNWTGAKNSTLSSIGFRFIGSFNNHFYVQLNPYYGFVLEENGTTVYWTDYDDVTIAGFSTLLGVGHNFDFGSAGLIIGGGLFGDFDFRLRDSFHEIEYSNSYDLTTELGLTAGLGVGVNFYIRMGHSFVINAGIMGAWNPLSYRMSVLWDTLDFERKTAFNEYQTLYSVNIGIGWSTR